CLITNDHVALHQVFKHANVSRPRVFHHAADGIFGKRRRLLAVILAVLAKEELEEDGNLFLTLAQRRNVNGDNVEAVKEIFAEGALFDGALQRFVGGGKDANVNRDVPLAAVAGKLAVLQYVQELRLQRGMHLADLIEEDGAVIGLLELAELLAVGAGERTRLVAEELTFEKLTWYRGAIHFD